MNEVRIKLCGLSREEDIRAVNALMPEYVGFVFFPKSSRCVTPERAAELKALLDSGIQAVGVFVDEDPEKAAALLENGVIDLAQLHGHEDAAYIASLRALTAKPLIQAFKIASREDAERAERSEADYILLDNGAGTGNAFDWNLIAGVRRPYFLAGGLTPENVGDAIRTLHPFAVDVSSGIETEKKKDPEKMRAFVNQTRNLKDIS